jgi:hypothetical protein
MMSITMGKHITKNGLSFLLAVVVCLVGLNQLKLVESFALLSSKTGPARTTTAFMAHHVAKDCDEQQQQSMMSVGAGAGQWVSNVAAAGVIGMSVMTAGVLGGAPQMANAASSRVVGEISGSGLVFKDKLLVESFADPKIQGVALYLTSFERPLTERLSKDFFSDPSASSLTCNKSADKVQVADNIVTSTAGEVRDVCAFCELGGVMLYRFCLVGWWMNDIPQ